MKNKLNRALQIARLIVAADHTLRYNQDQWKKVRGKFQSLVSELAKSHKMSRDSVSDQIMREAYRLPPLRRKPGKWS